MQVQRHQFTQPQTGGLNTVSGIVEPRAGPGLARTQRTRLGFLPWRQVCGHVINRLGGPQRATARS
jgi:hypothetical protein